MHLRYRETSIADLNTGESDVQLHNSDVILLYFFRKILPPTTINALFCSDQCILKKIASMSCHFEENIFQHHVKNVLTNKINQMQNRVACHPIRGENKSQTISLNSSNLMLIISCGGELKYLRETNTQAHEICHIEPEIVIRLKSQTERNVSKRKLTFTKTKKKHCKWKEKAIK